MIGTSTPARRSDQAILRERASKLAREPRAAAPGARTEVVTFRLMAETYAIETSFVREVYVLRNLTPIPCTPSFYLGVVNVRGRLCPVIELKRLLGLEESALTNAARVIIVSQGALEFGLVADAILGVEMISVDDILPSPAMRHEKEIALVRGVTRSQCIVLDGGRLLGLPDIVVNEHVPV